MLMLLAPKTSPVGKREISDHFGWEQPKLDFTSFQTEFMCRTGWLANASAECTSLFGRSGMAGSAPSSPEMIL